MGNLLKRCGDDNGACSAFRRAAAYGHPAWTPRALTDLGELLEQHGDLGDAAKSYEQAIALGDPSNNDGANIWSRQAAIRLEILFSRRGWTEAAQKVLMHATKEDPDNRARFVVDRAHTLIKRGDLGGAAAAFREAISLGRENAPQAAFSLNRLIREHGDLVAAHDDEAEPGPASDE
ncbi:tetratricopeptide repeat protein [Streptomyces tuirus]|uniref:Tetratricopeptide repeat protein n=1 Tax=Streptomyces tuirus TaxID=68278 RepID=A0A941FDT3_9ACTN|nr:tetratricopeptide repeat protein [Streptomyces tuirus]